MRYNTVVPHTSANGAGADREGNNSLQHGRYCGTTRTYQVMEGQSLALTGCFAMTVWRLSR